MENTVSQTDIAEIRAIRVLAEQTFCDEELAMNWLYNPVAVFNNKSASELWYSALGRLRIKATLERIKRGDFCA
ncbi:antitoxin Xre/MbcA/ParS toxin-binding domain-containing protein [Vibrio breoganii]